jgi:hypothetical protein
MIADRQLHKVQTFQEYEPSKSACRKAGVWPSRFLIVAELNTYTRLYAAGFLKVQIEFPNFTGKVWINPHLQSSDSISTSSLVFALPQQKNRLISEAVSFIIHLLITQ